MRSMGYTKLQRNHNEWTNPQNRGGLHLGHHKEDSNKHHEGDHKEQDKHHEGEQKAEAISGEDKKAEHGGGHGEQLKDFMHKIKKIKKMMSGGRGRGHGKKGHEEGHDQEGGEFKEEEEESASSSESEEE